jgi:hypothetical protein
MMNSKNPYQKYEDLFEGWPLVTASTVRGEHSLRVAGKHNTPDRLKRTSDLTLCAMVGYGALLAFCLYAERFNIEYNETYNPQTWLEVAVVVWVMLTGCTYLFLSMKAEKATVVGISPNFIQIGERVYDAKVQHKFTMDLHRKAKEEERAEALAEKRASQRGARPLWRHLRYYRESYHIYLEYLGQRILVTDIHNEEYAQKLLRALIAADRIVHQEKTVFATNANESIASNEPRMPYASDIERSPGARAERRGYALLLKNS